MNGGDYTKTLAVDVPVEAVYDAVCSPDRWWTADADIGPARVRLDFGPTFIEFRVDRAERPTDVEWTVVAQHDPNLPRPDEWVGTTLAWRLAEEASGTTRMTFTHHGLRPQVECYGICSRGWEHFLPDSIKALAETGEGRPWTPAGAA